MEKTKEINSVKVASLADIAAMKVITISKRGARRDFIDIYYLLKEFSLKEIFNFTTEKYPQFDIYNGLRGLLYFKDVEEQGRIRIKLFDENIS